MSFKSLLKKIEFFELVLFDHRDELWKFYNDSHWIISIVLHHVLDKFTNEDGNDFSGNYEIEKNYLSM